MTKIEGHRPRILHVAPAYFPAIIYGGPVFSTMAVCDGLAASGAVDVTVLTTDSNGPKVADRVEVDGNPVRFAAGYDVRYCRRIALGSVSVELLRRLPDHMRRADIVHLTSTYNFPTLPTLSLARIMGKPVVWSPRGALQATQQWQDAPRRGVKVAFERLCQRLRPRDTVLSVTAAEEAELSVSNLPGIRTAVIPNSIDVPEAPPVRDWRPGGRLRLMFLSRLHPKKGLDLLLTVLARLPEIVTLDVYGSGAPKYEADLARQVAELGLGRRVAFHGHVAGVAKTQAFAEADIMCLPTHSENFGLVVGEALAHGVPAITTTEAPWSGLEGHDCGRWIAPETDALEAAILTLQDADLAEMGARGRAWMARDFSSAGTTRTLLLVYDDLLARRSSADARPVTIEGGANDDR